MQCISLESFRHGQCSPHDEGMTWEGADKFIVTGRARCLNFELLFLTWLHEFGGGNDFFFKGWWHVGTSLFIQLVRRLKSWPQSRFESTAYL